MALNSAAKRSGVSRYDIFHNAGYQGLYGLSLSEIKHLKGIDGEDLLDRAGRAELAANEFRITQTEAKLIRENVSGEMEAVQTHKAVGSHVRETIQKLGGTMPEKLAPRAVDQENTQSKEIRPKIDGEIGERVDPT